MNILNWQWPMLALAVLAAMLFTLFPGIDLWATKLFYRPGEGFPFNQAPLGRFVVKGVPPLLIGILVYVLFLWVAGLWFGQILLGVGGRVAVFLLTSLAMGPGLIVNSLLKEFWGRARPIQTQPFGGAADFTPALLPTDQCTTNCSFAGGHAALAFWTLAFALLVPVPWRRPAIAASLLFGLVVGLARVAQGKHFLSDILFAGIIAVSVVLLCHDLLIGKAKTRPMAAAEGC